MCPLLQQLPWDTPSVCRQQLPIARTLINFLGNPVMAETPINPALGVQEQMVMEAMQHVQLQLHITRVWGGHHMMAMKLCTRQQAAARPLPATVPPCRCSPPLRAPPASNPLHPPAPSQDRGHSLPCSAAAPGAGKSSVPDCPRSHLSALFSAGLDQSKLFSLIIWKHFFFF